MLFLSTEQGMPKKGRTCLDAPGEGGQILFATEGEIRILTFSSSAQLQSKEANPVV